jgi:outer membrane protein assembly factor BamD
VNNRGVLTSILPISGLLFLLVLGCGKTLQLTGRSPQELKDLGLELYRDEQYFRATQVFQTLVYNYPGEPLIDTAQFYLAMSYFGNEEYEVAQVEFNRLLLNYPSSDFAVQAQFMRAASFFEMTPEHYGLDQTKLVDALQQFEDFVIDHPDAPQAADAKTFLLRGRTRLAHKDYESGMVYKHLNRYDPAITYFQKVIDDYTATEYAPKAAFQIGEVELKRKNFADAQQRLENFIAVYPEHEWAHKAREMLEEAAFKHAEATYKSLEYKEAQSLFRAFKQEFPESGRIDKADDYLSKLEEALTSQSSIEQADAGAGR